jgi:hypothetical protein|tara:strand:- start:3872 stop:4024 length:153 start_codon:yes stop_codon:yes gene_type:complete
MSDKLIALADAKRAVQEVVNARGNAAKAIGWDIVIALGRLDHHKEDSKHG